MRAPWMEISGKIIFLAAVSRLATQSPPLSPDRPWHSPEERQVISDEQRLHLPTLSIEPTGQDQCRKRTASRVEFRTQSRSQATDLRCFPGLLPAQCGGAGRSCGGKPGECTECATGG